MKRLISILSLCFIACNNNPRHPKESYSTITITNQSNKRIYNQIYWNYPDTAVGQHNPVRNNHILKPGDNAIRTASPNGYKIFWEKIFIKSDVENIDFSDADVIEKIQWAEVKKTAQAY